VKLAALLVLAACGPQAAPVTPPQPRAIDAGVADASEASVEERLAAIQKAMTDLDPVAHQCWAVVAAERFDIEGAFEARIDIPAGAGDAHVETVTDTTRTPKLTACMSKVLAAYPWAPPLHGQTIQLPFKFRAPDQQNVIDRALVPAHEQGKISIAVLIDSANTGSEAASMLDVTIAPGGTTGMRYADRPEVWYFRDAATVSGKPVAAGDLMFVPKDGAREVAATGKDAVHAVLVMVPGGREGVARAGALPTKEFTNIKVATVGPTVFANPTGMIQAGAISAGIHDLPPNVQAEHVVDTDKLFYVLDGAGTVTINGNAQAFGPTSVLQIPAGAKRAFTMSSHFLALELAIPKSK
jgi:quercetin dioxygenase-like cupin family protein